MPISKPALIEWVHAIVPTLPINEIERNVQNGIEYTDQFDKIIDLLLRRDAENFADGDPKAERWLNKWARRQYDRNIDDFAYNLDMRAVNELLDGLPTLRRPRVLLKNLS